MLEVWRVALSAVVLAFVVGSCGWTEHYGVSDIMELPEANLVPSQTERISSGGDRGDKISGSTIYRQVFRTTLSPDRIIAFYEAELASRNWAIVGRFSPSPGYVADKRWEKHDFGITLLVREPAVGDSASLEETTFQLTIAGRKER